MKYPPGVLTWQQSKEVSTKCSHLATVQGSIHQVFSSVLTWQQSKEVSTRCSHLATVQGSIHQVFSLGNSPRKYPPGVLTWQQSKEVSTKCCYLSLVMCRKFVCRERSWNEHVGILAPLFPLLSLEVPGAARAAKKTCQIEYRVSEADMQVV